MALDLGQLHKLNMMLPGPVDVSISQCSTVARGWIQVGGILAVLYGIYYLGAGIGDCCEMGAQGFYMSTILGRLVLSLSFAWLAGAQAVPQGILILAAVNLVGAASMVRALLPRSAS